MKKILTIVICLSAVLLSGCGKAAEAYFEEATEESAGLEMKTDGGTEAQTSDAMQKPQKDEDCCVYICGAVEHPGVYQLPPGSRVYEAVELAGGLTSDASFDAVNQAEEVTDGQMITVPTVEEQQAAQEEEQTSDASDGKVNINTADAAELMTLPGIGASKAESILSYREEQGSFSSVEEIMNITGIKEGVYSKIKDYITVH